MIGYLIKSSLCLIVLLIVYRIFLEQEKMHRFNRYFLVFGLMFSLGIPMLIIELPAPAISNAQLSNQIDRLTTTQSYEPLPVPGPADNQPASQQQTAVPIIPYLFMGYLLVSGVLLIRLLQNLYSLATKVYRNERVPFQKAVLVLVPDGKVPHSFFNYIFVNKQMYQAGTIDEAIFTHELTHVRQKHSLDILFIELLKVAFWFNPAMFFYKKAMQLNHEFLADETVVSGSRNVSAYQRLLLKIQTNEKDIQLTSSIQYSITKKRIMMMTKKSTTLQTLCKQLAIIPLLAALIFTFSTRTAASQDVSTMSLQELMEVVNKKMESADSLTPKEKQELSTLLSKIQDELNPQLSPPDPPETGDYFTLQAPPKASKKDSIAISEINKRYNKSVKAYLDILPTEENKEALETAFEKAKKIIDEHYNKYQEINRKHYDKPPPPPPIKFVKTPTERLEDYFYKKDLPPPPAPTPPSEHPEATLQRMVESYNKHGKFYSNIAPVEGNRDKLKASYEKVMILYNEVDKLQKEIKPDNPPPPPPKPLSPNERIERNSAKPQPPIKADTTQLKQERYQDALNFLFKEHSRVLQKYLEISPVDTDRNRKSLEILYEMITTVRDQYTETLSKYKKTSENPVSFKPLPSIPQNPTERIKTHAKNSSNVIQLPAYEKNRNLLRILVNEAGLILMDEELVPLEKVKAKVKEFITNNNADPDLSESPQKAVIAIKKSKSLPKSRFTDFFQEVEAAYLDLRNTAAQAEFGVNYNKLEKDSAAQLEIKEKYPKKISIEEPKKLK